MADSHPASRAAGAATGRTGGATDAAGAAPTADRHAAGTAGAADLAGAAPAVAPDRPMRPGVTTYRPRRADDTAPTWDFPGCSPVHLTTDTIDDFEGRLEFWDADCSTAWVVAEPVSPWHERPGYALSELISKISSVRGAPIQSFGAMALQLRGSGGALRRVLQADQALYLDPTPDNLPGQAGMVVGEHAFPDVILEVDYSTDARRSKLGLYEAWGFPEVWIDVPDRRPRSRPRRRLSGLTIHVLQDGVFRPAPASRAFPGWTADEIHTALNEHTLSVATIAVLERVGTALGARGGTGPDDDPFLRSQRQQKHAESLKEGQAQGFKKGHAKGRAQGIKEGRAQGFRKGQAQGFKEGRAQGIEEGLQQAVDQDRQRRRIEMARQLLRARGIPVPAGFPADAAALAACAEADIIEAAFDCDTADGLLARLTRR